MSERLSGTNNKAGEYWSERVRTGSHQENLIGLALSGGGIRSATFCLGVLQRLKELDLLRRIDYLSTVSGGGYIGSWLVGNIHRTQYWTDPNSSWARSIDHLRRHSKYLAPNSGIMSADTWVIWATWIRNALLVQLTTIACLATGLATVLAGKLVFDWFSNSLQPQVFAAILIWLGVWVSLNLLDLKIPLPFTGGRTNKGMVLLAWFVSFLSAAHQWKRAVVFGKQHVAYSDILKTPWDPWIAGAFVLAIAALALASVWPSEGTPDLNRLVVALISTAATIGTMHLLGSGVAYLFRDWIEGSQTWQTYGGWYAYVFGPPLMLLSGTLSIAVFIGMIGRSSRDRLQEWWTRFGAWIGMYGTIYLAVSIVAVFAPIAVNAVKDDWKSVQWASIAAWIGSTIAALKAGASSRTQGTGGGPSPHLEWIARAGDSSLLPARLCCAPRFCVRCWPR